MSEELDRHQESVAGGTKKDDIDGFIGYLENVAPQWSQLPVIDEIWDEMAIHHLKTTIKNQLGSVGLQAKMENYRKEKEKQPPGDARARTATKGP